MRVLKSLKKNGEDAVSPVVGVMLMLVVTIIIAAVVSAFSGGIIGTTQKAPTANVEIDLKNGGDSSSSYFSINVLSVSEPIHTKNLKLVTSWVTTNDDGSPLSGGGTSILGSEGATKDGDGTLNVSYNVPTGYGAGVDAWASSTSHPAGSQWGNFTWMSGTTMMDVPSSDYSDYQYGDSTCLDAMQAILGESWYKLKAGDIVNVRVIYAPSGKAVVDQKVSVEG